MGKLLVSALRHLLHLGQKDKQVASDVVTDSVEDQIWARRCDVLYRAWVQLRYHKKRQMFFDRADKLSKALTLLLSATLVGTDIKTYLPYVASIISFLSLLSLVFTYSDRKQAHKDLSESFGKLIADIEKIPPSSITAQNTAEWSSKHAEYVGKAPPPLKRLTILCEREQRLAQGVEIAPGQGLWENYFFLGKYLW